MSDDMRVLDSIDTEPVFKDSTVVSPQFRIASGTIGPNDVVEISRMAGGYMIVIHTCDE
jgi:hypothetical protein